MSLESFIVRPSIESWQVETLRMTGFPDPAATVEASTWWKELVGDEPERRISLPKKSGHQDEGPVGDSGILILKVEPPRIDWLLTVRHADQQERKTIPSMGSLVPLIDTFSEKMLRWFGLDTCPPLWRLAFGAIIFQPVPNMVMGYRHMQRYIPHLQLDSGEISDFLYQINRPRASTSGVANLRINRLTKWSVAHYRIDQVSFDMPRYDPGEPLFALHLELDINTVPTFRDVIARPHLPQVFQELVTLGQEIASEGDIP